MAVPRTADDAFNERQYGRLPDRAANQPNHSNVRNIRTASKKPGNQKAPSPRRTVADITQQIKILNTEAANSKQTIDQGFTASYANQGLQPSFKTNIEASKKKPSNFDEDSFTPPPQYRVVRNSQLAKKQTLKEDLISKTKEARQKVRVTRLNITILSTGTSLWLSFQLPFAILSLVMFATAATLSEIASMVTLDPDDGLTVTAAKAVGRFYFDIGDKIIDGLNLASKTLIGFDFSVLNPANLFLLTYIILIGLVIVELFVIYLLYKISLLNPLGGEGAGLKMGALILAIVGYSIPFLNLLPWFMVWTFAVWLKPK